MIDGAAVAEWSYDEWWAAFVVLVGLFVDSLRYR
jgi:hypothetical protein